jgi:glycolate oxidase subunit GlcD
MDDLHPSFKPTAVPSKLIAELQQIVGSPYVLIKPAERRVYECDACLLVQAPPDVIVLPKTTRQVADVVACCQTHKVAFTPRGGGTGTSGGALAIEAGVLISLNRMTRLIELNVAQRWVRVEVGMVNAWLNETLAEHGLFYAPDPSSQVACTIGGNIAENAGGIHCLKYGVTSDHVLGMTVVLPSGEIQTLGGLTRRAAHRTIGHHPNTLGLMIGSEGTLGIVTEVTLRLTPKPKATRVWLSAFKQMEAATKTVEAILLAGLIPSALEMMDAFTVRCVNEAFDVGFPESCEAVLLIELDGSQAWVEAQRQQLLSILEHYNPDGLRHEAEAPQARAQLWHARKSAVAAYGRLQPAFYVHDCVVPRSQLTHVLQEIVAIGERHRVPIGNVFHAGDGNLHPNILFNPADADMVARVLAAGADILSACVAAGGTLSGEHGIGLEKNQHMGLVFNEADLLAMKQVRTWYNPTGRCNPGKVFPSPKSCTGHGPRSLDSGRAHGAGLWI